MSQTINFPTIRLTDTNGKAREFALKYTYTTKYLLSRYGRQTVGECSQAELAAAMAHEVTKDGALRSCGFERPTDFTDLFPVDSDVDLFPAVTEALKKSLPGPGRLVGSGSGSDESGVSDDDADGDEEQLLRTWAFAVSRDGLGLTESRFWDTTPRELVAIKDVWDRRIRRERYHHADLIATLWNMHTETSGVPWTAEDLLGETKRQDRRNEKVAREFKSHLAATTGEVPELFLNLKRKQDEAKKRVN